MKNNIWEKRIPTLLGMLFILIGIVTTSLLVKQGTSFLGFASLSNTPENIRIANISDTSLTVSYTTAGKTSGAISYGTSDALGTTALDEDSNNQNTHFITLINLKPSTAYHFSIISGNTTFLNNGKPFLAATGPTIQESKEFTLRGKVIFENNTTSEALIYVANDSIETLSSRVKADGTYTIKIKPLRNSDLNSSASLKQNDTLRMVIIGQNTQSNVTFLATQTNPVPTIILSKNYDFTINNAPIATSSATFGFPTLVASPSALITPQIVTPKKGEQFIDVKPLFKGVASPSATVEIEIHSDENIKTTVTADKNGSWSFRPTNPLSAGSHIINITTHDMFGIIKTISQSFTVFAQGSQVNQSATPSATVVPSATATPTIIPTQIPSPTTITPTLVITQSPTGVPVVIPSSTPAVIQEDLPQPGNPSLIPLGIAATITTLAGISLLALSKGKIL